MIPERDITYIASPRHPETEYRCGEDTALVAKIRRVRRRMGIGESFERRAA